MESFALIFGLIWVASMGAWWFISRAFRNADVDKMKSRILDTTAKQEKKAKAGPTTPQLINREDLASGKLALSILKKFDLLNRLDILLEQAGLRWKPAKVVHTSLTLFLGGFLSARLLFSV